MCTPLQATTTEALRVEDDAFFGLMSSQIGYLAAHASAGDAAQENRTPVAAMQAGWLPQPMVMPLLTSVRGVARGTSASESARPRGGASTAGSLFSKSGRLRCGAYSGPVLIV